MVVSAGDVADRTIGSRMATHRSLGGESCFRSAFPFPFAVPCSSFFAVFLPA
jgi:hypothetical protein